MFLLNHLTFYFKQHTDGLMTTYGETKNGIKKWRPHKFGYNVLPNLTQPLISLMILFFNLQVETQLKPT